MSASVPLGVPVGVAITGVAAAVAVGLGGVRFLRVAQREHYVPGAALRFGWRWWVGAGPGVNRLLGALSVALLVASWWWWPAAVLAAGSVASGPVGLGLRGRTSPLAWTRRLRTLAAVGAILACLGLGAGVAVFVLSSAGAGALVLVATAIVVPGIVDLALWATAPLERRLVQPYVRRAAARLRQVGPVVVAITGSYGKTTTKGYVAHLSGRQLAVVATPRSFNNRAGLARAVNEHLEPGTQVFVAEMGTYGPGEIAELCSWVTPRVAVITAIGPVHLERFGTEARIVAAKSEILERAEVAVLNVDSPPLAELADKVAASGRRVLRCSGQWADADLSVLTGPDEEALVVRRGGALVAEVQGVEAAPTNVACAVAVALELGVSPEEVAARLPGLPSAPNRLVVRTTESGFTVIDDTFNSNPAGARLALASLCHHSADGHRRVVVTPGMVELGPSQRRENAALASAASTAATDLVIVGRTNRRALLEGAGAHGSPVLVDTRDEAVAWVRAHLGPGDAVLYENDLPDHFP
ncbi:MAG: UDP-N-acetylmuramoyl-tripeptide--D-alanyl-D-alanine ligase [Acidimicrobiales bacterium]|nr:UDP-N-acetylmuramoyl-tripeptide--D-alanyl-D-alanine ligase [Acidimicrobiales bacterium]